MFQSTGRSRWLALGGALLWLYAAWAPWGLLVRPATGLARLYPPMLAAYAGAGPFTPLLRPLLWQLLTPAGLLIAPWLWSHRFRVAASGAYALWAAVTILTGLVAAVVLFSIPIGGTPIRLTAPASTGPSSFAPTLGLVVAVAALALIGLAAVRVVLYAREQVRQQGWRHAFQGGRRLAAQPGDPPEVHARAGLISGGVGAITAGVLIWALAFLFLPWVLFPCNTSQLGATCRGLSGREVMWLGAQPAAGFLDPEVFRSAVPVLLLVGGALTLYAAWRLPVNARLCWWLAGWLLAASGGVALGLAGTMQAVQGNTSTGANLGTYPAGLIAAVGLALGWLGLIPLALAVYSGRKEQAGAS
jgi:hypothetical protein